MMQRNGRAERGMPPPTGHRDSVSRWARLCLAAMAAVLLAVLPGLASPVVAGSAPGSDTSTSGGGQRISGDHVTAMILRGSRPMPNRGWLDQARPDIHPVGWYPAVVVSGPQGPVPTLAVGSVVGRRAPGSGAPATGSACSRAPPRPSVDSTSWS